MHECVSYVTVAAVYYGAVLVVLGVSSKGNIKFKNIISDPVLNFY